MQRAQSCYFSNIPHIITHEQYYLGGYPGFNPRPSSMNDLPLTGPFQVQLFADDTNLTAYLISLQHRHFAKLVNNELVYTSNWMKVNKLTINYTKTEYIINHQQKRQILSGVLLHDSLSWKPQIERVSSKVGGGCKTLLMVYYSIIHSHLKLLP